MPNKSSTDLVEQAKQNIENLMPDQVSNEIQGGNVCLVDIRESEELERDGRINGSIHIPRGILEFCADVESPKYRSELNKNNRTILYCATGSRSALATATLKLMGYENVSHLDGGFNLWKDSGKPVVK